MTVASDLRESDEVYAAVLQLRRRGMVVRRRPGGHLVNGRRLTDAELIAMAASGFWG